MNIFEIKWRELLEDLIINHKRHVKDETQIREIIFQSHYRSDFNTNKILYNMLICFISIPL